MVMDEKDLLQEVNGYMYMTMPDGSTYIDVVEYSPFTGKEHPKALFRELQYKIDEEFRKADRDVELDRLYKEKHLMTNKFDVKDVPSEFVKLLNDRRWFEKEVELQREKHIKGKNFMCGGLSVFVKSLYDEEVLPLLATVPIKYCPFCGVELPKEFQTENWWTKEFKTFKWWKERGLCE